MAIEVDGEKYACDACVRGHRVSNCTHRDRELRHINKKGRPVSQCPHCRGMRKSRSAHVKCVCSDVAHGSVSPDTEHTSGCSCWSGGPCNCCVKRDAPTSDVNEIARTAAMNATHRRSASNGKPAMSYRKSDSTVPTARHSSFHPPLHRLNNAAHECGIPYPLKRSSASHGSLAGSTTRADIPPPPPPHQLTTYPPIPQMPEQRQSRASYDVGLADFASASPVQWDANFNATGEFGPSSYSVPSSATDSMPVSWSDYDLASSYSYNAMSQRNPQPPSVDSSVDQPSLSRSSSGTASDTAESSNAGFDVGYPVSQPLESIDWQNTVAATASWQDSAAFDFEEAFNAQKTPRAPTTADSMGGKFDDYFGQFTSDDPSTVEGEYAQWSSASPDVNLPSGGGALYGTSADAWTSQIDLSSYSSSYGAVNAAIHGSAAVNNNGTNNSSGAPGPVRTNSSTSTADPADWS